MAQPLSPNISSVSTVNIADRNIKSDSDFRSVQVKLKKIDGTLYCQYPNLDTLAALNPKIVLMRKSRRFCKKIDSDTRIIRHGWAVCSKGVEETMSIVSSYLQDANLTPNNKYISLGTNVEIYVLTNYVSDTNFFTGYRTYQTDGALFGICLRIDNPAYLGKKDDTTTSYFGVPRYLFSQIAPMRANIVINENSPTIKIGLL